MAFLVSGLVLVTSFCSFLVLVFGCGLGLVSLQFVFWFLVLKYLIWFGFLAFGCPSGVCGFGLGLASVLDPWIWLFWVRLGLPHGLFFCF